jgi:hypothetical protein
MKSVLGLIRSAIRPPIGEATAATAIDVAKRKSCDSGYSHRFCAPVWRGNLVRMSFFALASGCLE